MTLGLPSWPATLQPLEKIIINIIEKDDNRFLN
jgi:hypothetical protein